MPKIDAVSPSMIASGSVGRGAAARGRPHSRGSKARTRPRILVARDKAGTTAIECRTARLTKKYSCRVYTCYFYPVPRERAPAGRKRPVDSSSSPDEFCKTHGPRSFDLELGGPPSCGRHARCPLRDRGTAALITEQSRPPGTAFTAHEICPLDGTYFTMAEPPPPHYPANLLAIRYSTSAFRHRIGGYFTSSETLEAAATASTHRRLNGHMRHRSNASMRQALSPITVQCQGNRRTNRPCMLHAQAAV